MSAGPHDPGRPAAPPATPRQASGHFAFWRCPLPRLGGWQRRAVLRLILAAFSPWVEVVGREKLRRIPEPAIFAFNHGNSVEAVVVPSVLIAHRRGRLIRFLIDWIYLRIPLIGWLLRQIDPIPVYTKPARWRLFEGYRRRALARGAQEHRAAVGRGAADRRAISPVAATVEALAAGDSVGLFPEGTRNASVDSLLPGRKGLGYVVLASTAPVVPVGIDHPAKRRLGRIPKIGRMRVTVGEPMSFAVEREALRTADRTGTPRSDLELLRLRLARRVVEQVMVELAPLCAKRKPKVRGRPASMPGAFRQRSPVTLKGGTS